jgi:hypothetical protein
MYHPLYHPLKMYHPCARGKNPLAKTEAKVSKLTEDLEHNEKHVKKLQAEQAAYTASLDAQIDAAKKRGGNATELEARLAAYEKMAVTAVLVAKNAGADIRLKVIAEQRAAVAADNARADAVKEKARAVYVSQGGRAENFDAAWENILALKTAAALNPPVTKASYTKF